MLNAVRMYDMFGIAWATPIYFAPVRQAWGRVPTDLKAFKALSFAYGKSRHEEETSGIPYVMEDPAVSKAHGVLGKAWKALTMYWFGEEYLVDFLPFFAFVRQALARRIRVNGYLSERYKESLAKDLPTPEPGAVEWGRSLLDALRRKAAEPG
jgi:hypothetical protein